MEFKLEEVKYYDKQTDIGIISYLAEENSKLRAQLEGFVLNKDEKGQLLQDPIKVNWDTLNEIDSYDEQYCKQLLKRIMRERITQASMDYQIKTLQESNHKHAKELDQLKFKFKLCIDWPKCKNKGIYKQQYNDYTDSESWLCDKHRKNMERLGGIANEMFSKILNNTSKRRR